MTSTQAGARDSPRVPRSAFAPTLPPPQRTGASSQTPCNAHALPLVIYNRRARITAQPCMVSPCYSPCGLQDPPPPKPRGCARSGTPHRGCRCLSRSRSTPPPARGVAQGQPEASVASGDTPAAVPSLVAAARGKAWEDNTTEEAAHTPADAGVAEAPQQAARPAGAA